MDKDIAEPVDQSAEEHHARRASSFGAASAEYARHRPDYAESAIRWALEPLGAAGPRVLDLGAGTGILTAALVRLGVEVVAAEPDPQMLAELRRQLPQVAVIPSRAEAIALPEASVDAVLCGQSMHWFDLDRALPEIGRVLRPGGVLAGLWNMQDDRVAWVAALAELAGNTASVSGWRKAPVPGSERAVFEAGSTWFTPVHTAEFDNPRALTADAMVATIATTSQLLVMSDAERERTLAALRDFLAARPETASGTFTLPQVTGVLRAVRRDTPEP
ncbi:class I SAM-dependent methyltransferase [Actinospica robiniae]|uniref:class I SAM-dependent methyltransferase n=1 Tax=Actinospica robiniae TaxID=304901 RepID=UPI000425FF3B|nr:class I SAM-dependent methyltransferase [Actinospica robiniae]